MYECLYFSSCGCIHTRTYRYGEKEKEKCNGSNEERDIERKRETPRNIVNYKYTSLNFKYKYATYLMNNISTVLITILNSQNFNYQTI